jgi:hypothetical protein
MKRFLEVAPWLGAAVAFVCHVICIREYPWNFAFDGFQRWAGRDMILVQGWLPATQLLIYLVHLAGGQLLAVRIVLSLVACLGVWFGVRLAGHLGGPVAAGAMVVAASFGPFTVWTSTLYQEGTFLCLLFAGLSMAGEEKWLAADLLMGALGLTRYEGWPYVFLYLLWRRDPKAILSLWGITLWLFLYGVFGVRGGQPSPINIDDWEGLTDRFRPWNWLGDVLDLAKMGVNSGGITWMILGAVSLYQRRTLKILWLLSAMILVQLVITGVWMVGLGEEIARMLVVPGMLAALLAAPGIGALWGRLRWAGIAGGLWMMGVGVFYTTSFVQNSAADDSSPERRLIEKMVQCEDCTWWMEPRTGLGTRQRHDGCEVVQGLSQMRVGQQFWCSRWIPEEQWPEARKKCTGEIRWVKQANGSGRYLVTEDARVVPTEPPGPGSSP